MADINVLTNEVAQLIAAGEVVERPASVIKELVENAIDAKATRITVEIRRGGISYIRVTDNGSGISRENVKKAFLNHATSKIKNSDDLDSIFTLGFRGEALASISAVSRVEMLTKTENETIGTRYEAEGSVEVDFDDAGCPQGTTVVVRDLFFNTPARMKFLKKDTTEANAVAAVMDRLALSHPEIAFAFIRDGKQILATPGDGSLKNAVYSIFGREFSSGLIECDYSLNGVRVSGYISKPVSARANRMMQFFFINGRLIKTRTGCAALEQAYRNSIMVGKFPACVLMIELPAQAVDVNVHPAKTEVRFQDEKKIFDAVYYCAKYALSEGDTRPQMSLEGKAAYTLGSQSIPKKLSGDQLHITAREAAELFAPKTDITPEESAPQASFEQSFKSSRLVFRSPENENPVSQSDESLLLNNPTQNADKDEPEDDIPVPAEKSYSPTDDLRIVGEAFKTYIIAQLGDKLIFIDKHAAHERMIFEEQKKSHGAIESQVLLTPVTVTLSKEEYGAVIQNADLFEKAGYSVSDLGSGTVLVSECPTYLADSAQAPQAAVTEIICELAEKFSLSGKDIIPEKLDWIYHSTACRAAIKAGDRTSGYELEKFVAALLENDDIRYCPHGRPVIMEMSRREIEKNFGRIV